MYVSWSVPKYNQGRPYWEKYRGCDIVATLPTQNKNSLKAKNNQPNTENNNWKETWCIVLLWLKVKTEQVSCFKLRSPQHLWISLEIK